jgi:hypothetical protein
VRRGIAPQYSPEDIYAGTLWPIRQRWPISERSTRLVQKDIPISSARAHGCVHRCHRACPKMTMRRRYQSYGCLQHGLVPSVLKTPKGWRT